MHCGRRFKDETLEKHEPICQKIFCTQRKKFDIKKKRVLDSEHAMLLKRSEREGVDKKLMKVKEQKKQKWKKMSEEFRSIVKSTATDGFGGLNILKKYFFIRIFHKLVYLKLKLVSQY